MKNYTNRDIKKLLKEHGFQEGKREKDSLGYWNFTRPGFITRETTDLRKKIIRIEIHQTAPTKFLSFITEETRALFNEIMAVLKSNCYDLDPGQWGTEMIIQIDKENPFIRS